MKLSVVSPTYNEADNLAPLVKELATVLGGLEYEIIIVDDDSPDLTWKRAEELGQRYPQVRSLRRTRNRGLSAAVIEGFSVARGEMVACMDADLQHDPHILPQMLQELEKGGADLVVGSRYVEGGGTGEWGRHRWISSWAATMLARSLLQVNLKDPMSGFFLMRRSDFLKLRDKLDGRGFKILLEIVARQPKRIAEVAYTFRNRRLGKSKLSGLVVLQYFQQLWKLSRHAAGRLEREKHQLITMEAPRDEVGHDQRRA